jgi:DNA-binding PadR family transcriptional regulator
VRRARLPDLSLTEWGVLALTAEHPTHGFAIAKEFAPDGDLGRIWTIPRPVVYRALARLEQLELVEGLGVEPGDGGPPRTRLGATPGGRAAVEEWLRTPSAHVRDLRTRLLLQLRLLNRRGRDLAPLAAAQLDRLRPILTALGDQVGATTGFEGLLVRWRYESALAVARVVEGLVIEAATPSRTP